MSVVVIDYGMGNVASVKNAVDALGYDAVISRKKEDIENASHIILPGVGAFGNGIHNLIDFGLADLLGKEILQKGKPFLGLCLGLQLLADTGQEGGAYKGLGWIRGYVRRFQVNESKVKVPHVGWDDIIIKRQSVLFQNIRKPIFYFVHSYHLIPEDESIVIAKTEYGETFVAAIEKENIFGLQFHPEKSQREGLRLLKNFLQIR
ncbi:MAG: imidazole glycerol phosphate synthase subunit HisH [Candidatus Wildermuthbacteria bacterium]|nr:imidazole glycerol phosphate synthase subunit HisH [Candidatus Wildermuthbacteria bacterium]